MNEMVWFCAAEAENKCSPMEEPTDCPGEAISTSLRVLCSEDTDCPIKSPEQNDVRTDSPQNDVNNSTDDPEESTPVKRFKYDDNENCIDDYDASRQDTTYRDVSRQDATYPDVCRDVSGIINKPGNETPGVTDEERFYMRNSIHLNQGFTFQQAWGVHYIRIYVRPIGVVSEALTASHQVSANDLQVVLWLHDEYSMSLLTFPVRFHLFSINSQVNSVVVINDVSLQLPATSLRYYLKNLVTF